MTPTERLAKIAFDSHDAMTRISRRHQEDLREHRIHFNKLWAAAWKEHEAALREGKKGTKP
jgi:hypothetical protein